MAENKIVIPSNVLPSALSESADFLKPLVQNLVQEALESQMDELIGAGKYERNDDRRGHRSGYYSRGLVTRVGKLELRVPQDRQGRFSTDIFERYQRCEKAFVTTWCQMDIQGVSTRKVRKVTEELCRHQVSASTVSRLNKKLDAEFTRFTNRTLDQDYPYLILDARYEKVRENGVIRSRAVLVALGISWDGRREVLAVELANRESKTSWKNFLLELKQRALSGVELVISDSHEGLKRAIGEVLSEASWQRCYVHFLRNAADHLSRKADPDCMLERLNQELKRRTHVVRIFPNAESCLRLVRALAVETHEHWIEQHRYLNMEMLRENRKIRLEQDGEAA